MTKTSICILPKYRGIGGPASFQARLAGGLRARGIDVIANPLDPACRAVLVVGGTRRLDLLWRARQKGTRIVQRLNGMNWLHKKINTGRKHYLKSEINNWILATIRRSLADAVVYQSQFARNWWQTVYGATRAPGKVIYNGVDLCQFQPDPAITRPDSFYRVLMVEGHMAGGYEQGLETGMRFIQELNRISPLPARLVIAGEVSDELKERWRQETGDTVEWAGVVPGKEIPALDRSAHVLFSSDLNAACPNSVIEAMACGLPVVAFSTGSLPELIDGQAGVVVPYGSNYWNLEKPDVVSLAAAASEVLAKQDIYRAAARARAEQSFGLEEMVERYWGVLSE